MGAKRRIKAKIEAAVDKAREAIGEVHAGGTDARRLMAKVEALVDLVVDAVDDALDRGVEVKLKIGDWEIPLSAILGLVPEDKEVTDGQDE